MQISTKLAGAMQLLSQYAPVRLTALQRDLPRLFIVPLHNIAECHYGATMCLVQFEYVAAVQTSPLQLAMTLVHEGTHARLLRAGFSYEEPMRRRVESLCVLSEILLARRIPDADADIAGAERRLQRSDEYWTDAAALEPLRNMGLFGKVAYYPLRLVLYFRSLVKKRAA
jgi:hypothetical protein